MTNCIGVPDERVEEKECRIFELEDQVESLQKEIFKMTQDSKGFTKTKSKDENDLIMKDITRSNALLRRKLDDAL